MISTGTNLFDQIRHVYIFVVANGKAQSFKLKSDSIASLCFKAASSEQVKLDRATIVHIRMGDDLHNDGLYGGIIDRKNRCY
jgi:hypothetical protein